MEVGCHKLVFKDGVWGCKDGEMPFLCVISKAKNISECTVKFEEKK
jgi:hypothetical protein